jgi:hypothetical protein
MLLELAFGRLVLQDRELMTHRTSHLMWFLRNRVMAWAVPIVYGRRMMYTSDIKESPVSLLREERPSMSTPP